MSLVKNAKKKKVKNSIEKPDKRQGDSRKTQETRVCAGGGLKESYNWKSLFVREDSVAGVQNDEEKAGTEARENKEKKRR